MRPYLSEAFFARLHIPLLGAVPANALVFAGLMILGLGHPGFWFLGMAAEIVYLWGLVGNARFRKWVDAKSLGAAKDRDAVGMDEMLARLNVEHKTEARELARLCNQVQETYRINQTEESIIENNLAALRRLQVLHARLLLARQQIEQREGENDDAELLRETAALEQELKQPGLPESLLRSKKATFEILQKRLRAVRARSTTRDEIDSDLKRILSQVELALDHATMQTKPPAISLDLELSSQIIDTGPVEFNSPGPDRPIAN